MSTRILDTRPLLAMSQDDADTLFQRLAETVIAATAAAAAFEKKLAAVKSAAAAAQEEYDAIINPLETKLRDYIQANPDRFAKPRMRKTEWGSYGLRQVTNVEISDPVAAMISVKAQGIPAVITTERLDKKAVERAIADGMTVSGAEVRTGEVAKYDIRRDLLDQVRG